MSTFELIAKYTQLTLFAVVLVMFVAIIYLAIKNKFIKG
jgi:hypothetical protein